MVKPRLRNSENSPRMGGGGARPLWGGHVGTSEWSYCTMPVHSKRDPFVPPDMPKRSTLCLLAGSVASFCGCGGAWPPGQGSLFSLPAPWWTPLTDEPAGGHQLHLFFSPVVSWCLVFAWCDLLCSLKVSRCELGQHFWPLPSPFFLPRSVPAF